MAQVQVQPQATNGASSAAAAVAGGNQFVTTSLYVCDLEQNVTDSQLYETFNLLGQVISVRVCRDIATHRSLGYGYVNYGNPLDAAKALDQLNFTPLNGKLIRIMYSRRDPSVRKSGTGNIFIKNLDKSIDHKQLYDIFLSFGTIISCKVATDSSGQSRGHGFVQFEEDEAAQKAILKLNGMLINDKPVFVGPFLRKQERDMTVSKFTNVFVKNLSESTTEEDLKKTFGEFGPVTSVVVMRDTDGTSKCFGFVNFESTDDAAKSVESLNGKKFDNKEWYVGKAQKKSEREQELKTRLEQSVKEVTEKSVGLNLYVKNLDDSIGDEDLKELFASFGTITSSKVMRDPSGISKGSGFVAFSAPEEANKALSEMNGKMNHGKPLYVAHAQKKEDRRARLQAQFSQIRPMNVGPASMGPRMPMYPPAGPGIGQQIFYGQGPPAMMSPQPGFGYQQQLVPGMRPGAPNFFMPMVQPRPGGGRPRPVQPMMQQQMMPRGGVGSYRYQPGRGMQGGMPLRENVGLSHQQPIPIQALASALANAPPLDQRTMLGESLYPLVENVEPENAAKVTGMLLEMDQTEVLHLLEAPEALHAKVAEAMEVLRNVQQQQAAASAAAGPSSPTQQLAGLSLD